MRYRKMASFPTSTILCILGKCQQLEMANLVSNCRFY